MLLFALSLPLKCSEMFDKDSETRNNCPQSRYLGICIYVYVHSCSIMRLRYPHPPVTYLSPHPVLPADLVPLFSPTCCALLPCPLPRNPSVGDVCGFSLLSPQERVSGVRPPDSTVWPGRPSLRPDLAARAGGAGWYRTDVVTGGGILF